MSLFELFSPPEPGAVVKDFGPQVLRHLKRIFGPRADVDDVYQLVFIEVLRSLPRFRGKAKLSTWIRRITWNVAYQEMRLRYKNLETPGLEAVAATVAAESEDHERREAVHHLYAALGCLTPKQRLAVVLHDVEGRTLKEIAEAMGRPLPTVASQLAAGRQKLAAMLAGVVVHQRQEEGAGGGRSMSCRTTP